MTTSAAQVIDEQSRTYTTAEVAAYLRCADRKVLELARELGVGYNLRGAAGTRYTDDDVARILKALRPEPVPEKRRKRRRT